MKCRKIEVLIYQYSELSPPEMSMVTGHIQTCLSCKKLLEQITQQQNLMRQAAQVQTEIRNAAHLTNKIMLAIQLKPRASWWSLFETHTLFIPRLAAGVAASLLVIFFAAEFFQENIPKTTFSKINKGASTLNTSRFLTTHWKRKEITAGTVSFYNCLKQNDCDFKKFKTN